MQGRGISASTPSCETRHRMHPVASRICQIYTQYFRRSCFFSLSFFLRASYRKLYRKTERGGRKIHYVPASLVAIGKQRSPNVPLSNAAHGSVHYWRSRASFEQADRVRLLQWGKKHAKGAVVTAIIIDIPSINLLSQVRYKYKRKLV